MVNQYYFYCVDRDFGLFFLKFCSYFPYNGKVCLNGNEYLKRQLELEGIAFEALDNGLLGCAEPERAQQIADELSADKIDGLVRKWFARLPHPFPARDRKAGYTYDVSVLQAEFSRTQVFDRPLSKRIFFEQVIRNNLDLGRPDQAPLVCPSAPARSGHPQPRHPATSRGASAKSLRATRRCHRPGLGRPADRRIAGAHSTDERT